jgi:STE24 endopeptidase
MTGLGIIPSLDTLVTTLKETQQLYTLVFLMIIWMLVPIPIVIVGLLIFYPSIQQIGKVAWKLNEVIKIATLAQLSLSCWVIVILKILEWQNENLWVDGPILLLAIALALLFSRFLSKYLLAGFSGLVVENVNERGKQLARKANLTLKEVIVLPRNKWHTFNAFVVLWTDRKIYITEGLLSLLDNKQIDIVIAHELGHIKFRHREKLLSSILLIGIPITKMTVILADWLNTTTFTIFMILLSSICLSILFFFKRRFEYEADRYAVELTRDPATSIAVLVQVHAPAKTPEHWLRRIFSTHPTLEERANAIAEFSGISTEQLQYLLNYRYY